MVISVRYKEVIQAQLARPLCGLSLNLETIHMSPTNKIFPLDLGLGIHYLGNEEYILLVSNSSRSSNQSSMMSFFSLASNFMVVRFQVSNLCSLGRASLPLNPHEMFFFWVLSSTYMFINYHFNLSSWS